MVGRQVNQVNYDEIAAGYDQQPLRQKSVDAQLLAFLADHLTNAGQTLSILDLGCGTGSQLIANQPHLPNACLVGLDYSAGMLHQAQRKAVAINWIQADSSCPPFAAQSFDYISNQFSFHHVGDKAGMFRAIYHLLRPGGRLMVLNIVPSEMPDWLYYRYFPASFEADLYDYPPLDQLVDWLIEAGFSQKSVDLDHFVTEVELSKFAETARQRQNSSQLLIISDADYQAGLDRLEAEVQAANGQPLFMRDEVCLMTLLAAKQ
jgi:ubiquinone/menaquinone biosynthesis C-methylase UbiE